MPGLIAVHQRLSIGSVVDDLLLVATCSLPSDLAGRIHFLPLRYPETRAQRKNAEPAFANSAFSFLLRGGDTADVPRGFVVIGVALAA